LHFGPLFLEIGSTDFVILSLVDSTYSLLAILKFKKNMILGTQINFAQSWEKTRKVTFSGVKYASEAIFGHMYLNEQA